MQGHHGKLILIVDDEAEIRTLLSEVLHQAGYRVVAVADGATMKQQLEMHPFVLLILDLRLRGEDGLLLARQVREQSPIPIMMLTGKGDETDRILGLELAADDFLMKPFNIRELVARVHALLRRTTELSMTFATKVEQPHDWLSFGEWRLDLTARELCHRDGRRVDLTFGEFSLLEALVRHTGRVMSREQLLEHSRGLECDVFDRTIDVLILRLRRKIEPNPKQPLYIRTERGVGYLFNVPVQALVQ